MRNVLLLGLASMAGFSAQAAYHDVVLADQPTGYWRLGDADGTAGVANSGTLGEAAAGTASGFATFGMPGALIGDADTAVNLDGAQTKIEIPFAPELNSTAFTIEAWAKTTFDSTGYRSPLAGRDDNPQRGYIFYANPSEEWQFWTGTGENVGWNILGGWTVEPEVWTHLVGSYDGTNKFFYVNGLLVGANQSAYGPNEARPLRIGASANENPVGDFFFRGDIDEVAVYNKALSPERVAAHFEAGTGLPGSQDWPPTVVVQPPATTSTFKGEPFNLTALATGSIPMEYQWSKDGVEIQGATNHTLQFTNLQPSDGGSYTVVIRNSAGEAFTEAALLEVADITIPQITLQPAPRTVLPGTTASFAVEAVGSTTFEYQWQFGGTDLAGQTNATLVVTNVQSSNLGTYRVLVTNPAGTTTSEEATLAFPEAAEKSYAETVQEDTPTGYWRLDETSGDVVEDLAGENDGFILNGVELGRPGALVDDSNTAAGFTQANQSKIDIFWSDLLNPPVFTVELWAKVTGGTGHRSPLTSRGDFPQSGYIFYAEPGNTWQFWVGSSEPLGWVTVPGPAVQLNTYAHLVGVYDGTNVSFYVNGVLAGTRAAVVELNSLYPLRIGGGVTETEGDFFFEGDVDEVSVYNTALSEERILAHYVAGFPLTTPPSITRQPESRTLPPGGTLNLQVEATGGLPLAYEWRLNGTALASQTNAALTITNVSNANAGDYTVVISNAGGFITSSVARLNIPTPSTKTYEQLVRDDGPVGYWRLGETEGDVADDVIGFNDGLYLNGVELGVPGAIPGDTNTAARFVQSLTQMVDVPWTDVLNPPVFTAEVWARSTGGTSYRSPLTSRGDGPTKGYIFYAAPDNTWQFWSGREGGGWDSIAGPAVVTNEWVHLAGTYDGTTKRFYVNGVHAGSLVGSFVPNDYAVLRFGAGASEGPGSYFFEGDVDEPAIYDKVLTEEQIILHYLAGPGPTEPEPEAELEITRDGESLILSWETGTLQSVETIDGDWTAVDGATSPHTIEPGEERARFFRVLVEP